MSIALHALPYVAFNTFVTIIIIIIIVLLDLMLILSILLLLLEQELHLLLLKRQNAVTLFLHTTLIVIELAHCD